MRRVVVRMDRVIVDEAALAGRNRPEWADALEQAVRAAVGTGLLDSRPVDGAVDRLRVVAGGRGVHDLGQAIAAAVRSAGGGPDGAGSAPAGPPGGGAPR